MKHKIYITEKMVKDILLIFLSAVIITGSFFGCEEKQDPSKIPYGIYTYTYDNGVTSTITLTSETVCIQNGDYTYSDQIYALRCWQSAIQEATAEGITLTKEEKDKVFSDAIDEADFTMYDGMELHYFLDYWESDQSIQLYTKDENGNEIVGLQATYEIKDKALGFADVYYKLQD